MKHALAEVFMNSIPDDTKRLIDLKPGESAQVVGYDPGEPAYRMKLLALGLTRGVSFKVIKAAPLGDPVEIEVRGYRLSLRKLEATTIQVRRLP
jgi:Fe2+ transport system protein FeoA